MTLTVIHNPQKEKKKLQNNLTIISKARNELAEQNTAMEEAAKKHEKDYAELALRMSETLKEYEIKLAQKDEQMVSLGNKLADASDVKLAPPPVAPPVVPVQLPVVSEEFENKWRSRRRVKGASFRMSEYFTVQTNHSRQGSKVRERNRVAQSDTRKQGFTYRV